MEKLNAIDRLGFFKSHTLMFVMNDDYENLTSFISGMDYASNGTLLSGFKDWLVLRYKIGSSFSWMHFINYLYEEKIGPVTGSKTDFLFSNVLEYLKNA